MQLLTPSEIDWARILAKEPTREQRKRRYLYHGFLYYLIMCRRYPKQAAAEIGALVLIFALMFSMMWITEIAGWVQEVLR